MKMKLSLILRTVISTAFFFCAWTSNANENYSSPKAKKTVTPQLDSKHLNAAGEVKVEATVNKFGFVTEVEVLSSTNEVLNEACVDAFHHWIFRPSEKAGKPVHSKVVQDFVFSNGTISIGKKANQKMRRPSPIKRITPDLPRQFANINGQVNFLVDLEKDGKIAQITLKETSHEELVGPSVEALNQWKFRPAVSNGKEVASTVVVPFHFNADYSSKARTIRNSMEINLVDVQPKPIKKHEPVLPISLAKKKGDAWLLVYVDEHGFVAEADVLKTSSPELGTHAKIAAQQWTFEPAMKDGQPVASKISVPFRFTGGLLLAEKKIDRQPKVQKSKLPELPSSLSGKSGYISILVSLDDQGKVVKALAKRSSSEEFEQPTIEAVKQWTFRPAMRDGTTVPSTVLVPFKFGRS